jgi:GTP cyclohydrolase I
MATILSNRDIARAASKLIDVMNEADHLAFTMPNKVYGVPRGGIPAALAVVAELHALGYKALLIDDPAEADFIIDDIVDSGATKARYGEECPGKPFYALFEKPGDWLVFPWEGTTTVSASDIPTRLLEFIGEDVEREGLKETPARFLAAWQEWCSGYKEDPAKILKAFKDGADNVDEMVLVRDIPIFSHCEHHLAPFFGKAHVAYIPNGKIVGLSKIPRLVQIFMRRLQVQERLTQQIASAIQQGLEPRGVGVVLECRHMCMESRGVKVPGSSTTTSSLLGAFKTDAAARAEFMRLVR